MSSSKLAKDEQSLKCQQCHLPLQFDDSLLDLSLNQKSSLIDSVPMDQQQLASQPIFKIPKDRLQKLQSIKNINDLPPALKAGTTLDSYVYLKKSQLGKEERERQDVEEEEGDNESIPSGNGKTLSSQINALSNIFNILSSKTKIDYPVCQDCCNSMIQDLKNQYDEAIKERETYTAFLNKLEMKVTTEPENSSDKKSASTDSLISIEDLKSTRNSLFEELLKLEKEDEELDRQIEDLKDELEQKGMKDLNEMAEVNKTHLEQLQFIQEVQSLQNQYDSALTDLDELRKINIYNETFKIDHNGPFGTINGLRIGGFEECKVPWRERNAGIGQIILLLATIGNRLNFKLKGYRLRPMGSYSKIMKLSTESQDWISYEAFHEENFKIGRLFRKETDFDKALECLLDIVQQMADRLPNSPTDTTNDESSLVAPSSAVNETVELPYIMHKDKINAISVKLYGAEPNLPWTTAMKFFLTNVKWLLAFSSSKLAS
ncbi:beclin 1 NDAI_0E02420 [Naumovozyma dairenensis CBS 421]|uniref:Uncharacterized protein n=1 Tax=Naumovozyma dairenensis (strain ATCC 10597 / BCRC 20456 / CBS 421 / NBRC 0211 / NRRL Y-12639) TaxID=1071378 RepID=G0WBD9_NAUDC|nr:hypothetical protein NDAI_0E02420 [Naumovozyma dairenensis CBS 421]CCD25059.1 hypothetical protein NDAI_0E02420 [Naumovozyma dairenensis CBS 421]